MKKMKKGYIIIQFILNVIAAMSVYYIVESDRSVEDSTLLVVTGFFLILAMFLINSVIYFKFYKGIKD